MPSPLTIIVAVDTNNGIGIGGALPWRLPQDLAHFKRTTWDHAIVMGRKTFESIGKPLPGRQNIVLTRNPEWHHPGVQTISSLAELDQQAGEIFIIGGAEIYHATQHLVQSMIVTEIDHSFKCDAFFPKIDPQQWKEISRETFNSSDNNFNYAFVVYRRQASSNIT